MQLSIFSILFTLLLCFYCTPLECARLSKRIKPHIVNGNDAAPGQFPWQVNLNVYGDYTWWTCGGAILSERHIVTAASCATNNFLDLEVYIPDSDQKLMSFTVFGPGGYEDNTLASNIALVELEDPIILNDKIKPIELSSEYIEENVEIVVSGWGQTSDNFNSDASTLQYVTLSTMNNKDCGSIYGEGNILDDMLCAKSSTNVTKGACFGDSGGPAMVSVNGTYVLVGVVSFISDRGCEFGDPSGFTRVSAHIDWLRQYSQN